MTSTIVCRGVMPSVSELRAGLDRSLRCRTEDFGKDGATLKTEPGTAASCVEFDQGKGSKQEIDEQDDESRRTARDSVQAMAAQRSGQSGDRRSGTTTMPTGTARKTQRGQLQRLQRGPQQLRQ
jgi:hypothetical protein